MVVRATMTMLVVVFTCVVVVVTGLGRLRVVMGKEVTHAGGLFSVRVGRSALF